MLAGVPPGSGTALWDLLVKLWVTFLAGLNFQSFKLEWISFSNYSVLMILGATIGCGDKNIFRKNEAI